MILTSIFTNVTDLFCIKGLFRDDIISENDPVIQEALKRLSDKEAFDRTFRLRRAIQLNLNHDILSKSEQTKPEDVIQNIYFILYKYLILILNRKFLIFGNMLKPFVRKGMKLQRSITFSQLELKTFSNHL